MYVCFFESKCVSIDAFMTVLFNSSNARLHASLQMNDTFFRVNLINDFTIFAKFLMKRL
jgi:myo-inositol-1-phosphate synthase